MMGGQTIQHPFYNSSIPAHGIKSLKIELNLMQQLTQVIVAFPTALRQSELELRHLQPHMVQVIACITVHPQRVKRSGE